MKGITRRLVIVLALATMLASIGTTAAMAAKGGGGGKGHHRNAYTGSFALVLLDSTDGVAHYGQRVTFDVTSTATYTFVDVDCYQGGTLVYHQGVGFYPGYPWSQVFTLEGWAWPGGAADCNARLYYTDSAGQNATTLATMSFHVFE